MMRASRLRWSIIFVLTLVMGAVAVPAAGRDSKAILLLHSTGHDGPGRFPFDTAFARTLRELADVKVDLYIETLDLNRFAGEAHARRTRDYLREKYAGKTITVVAVVWDEALAFLLDERDPLFPTVPIAAALLGRPQPLPERVAAMFVGNVVGETIALALRLHPQARQVAVIDGAVPGARGGDALNDEVQSQIKALGLRVPVVVLHDLPLDKLLPRVQAMPTDGIIFLVRQFIGPRGEPIEHLRAVREVARVAPAPLYVSTDAMIGVGALGGVVMPAEGIATDLAKLALRISQPGSQPLPPTEATLVPLFDWRELRRWGIDERLLPPDSKILFRELGLWDQYRWHAITAVSVFLVQSGLIAGLVLQGARRRRTELALRESEARMSMAIEAGDFGIWIWEFARDDIWASDSWRHLFGFAPSEQVKLDTVLERTHPNDCDGLRQTREMVLAGLDGGRYQTEYRVVLPNGTTRWIASRGRVEFDATGRPVRLRGASRDVTVRKQGEQEAILLRQEIAHAGRVSMLGQLASGLAHEINQPLAAILRNTEAAELYLSRPSPDLDEVRAILTDIRADDERAGKVIGRMRGLLQRHTLDTRRLEVGALVGDVAALVRVDAAARHVKLDVGVPGGLPPVRGDRVHLQQVLLNLILNGMDALNGARLEDRRVSLTARIDGAQAIEIAVADTGPGIAGDQLARIFEPFFTTKSNGMGMGLAISRLIVEAHGGRLWAENGDGGGAAFRFTLPAAEEAAGE